MAAPARGGRQPSRGSTRLAGALLVVLLGGPLVTALANNDEAGAPAGQPAATEVSPARVPVNNPGRPRSRLNRNRAANADEGTDVPAVKAAVQRAQQRFNDAQMLSTEPRRRWRQAQRIRADVQAAKARGIEAFVAEAVAAGGVTGADRSRGSAVTDFRIRLVSALDASVVVEEAQRLSAALAQDTADTFIPSLVQSTFLVDEWLSVQVRGDQATAVLIGRYANCFDGGYLSHRECVTDRRSQWQLTMRRGADGVWRITRRLGGDQRAVPGWVRAAATQGQHWLFDLYQLHTGGRGQVDWRRYYLTRTAAQRIAMGGYGIASAGTADISVRDERVRRGHVTLTAVAHVTSEPDTDGTQTNADRAWPACMFP